MQPAQKNTVGVDRRGLLQGLAAWALAVPAAAQTPMQTRARRMEPWPQRPVNLIVPFPAGGPSAILAKQLARAFEHTTHQPLRLLYQGGSGGLQGAAFAAKAAANGDHLFIGGSHLTVTRALSSTEDFDLMQDLRPLAMVAQVPQVLVVNPERVRARTVMEWLADQGRKSSRYRMATAGVGSSSHISAEMLKHEEGLRYEFVHFRGAGPAVQDLLAGSVDMMIDGVVSSLPHIRSGRLKALMVTGRQRTPVLPDVPCAQEMGMEVLEHLTWYGLFAPSQLSDAQAQAMQAVFQRMGHDAALNASFEAMGIRWADLYGDAFNTVVKQETREWAQRVKSLGLKNVWTTNAEES